jgi:hypothetical protein
VSYEHEPSIKDLVSTDILGTYILNYNPDDIPRYDNMEGILNPWNLEVPALAWIELKKDNTYRLVTFCRWQIGKDTSYRYDRAIIYVPRIGCRKSTGEFAKTGCIDSWAFYMEKDDTLKDVYDFGMIYKKQQGVKLILKGQDKRLWSEYFDQRDKIFLEFKEDGTCLLAQFGRWESKGDSLTIYTKGRGEEFSAEWKTRNNRIAWPNGVVFVKQRAN